MGRYNVVKNPRWLAMLALSLAVFLFAFLARVGLAVIIEHITVGTPFDFFHSFIPIFREYAGLILFVYSYFTVLLTLFFISTKTYYDIKDIPYSVLVFAAAFLVSAVMSSVTIIRPPHNIFNLSSAFARDLFPSMKIGSAFLFYLLSSKKWLKRVFLAALAIVIINLLLLRLHYTVDVISSLLVVYGVYCLCKKYLRPLLNRFY